MSIVLILLEAISLFCVVYNFHKITEDIGLPIYDHSQCFQLFWL